jgi:hypothetical protein
MLDATTEIKNQWKIISSGPSSILELRALCPSRSKPAKTLHFRANEHESVDACKQAFEVEALKLNADGYNIYIVMNPIRSDFKGGAATDQDIAYRDLVLIDIDRAATAKEPATDSEVEEARKLADAVEAHLNSKGCGNPIRTMSGNGHHLYYVLSDIPNNEESTQAIQLFLKKLAAEFNNGLFKIDTTVSNASRITKVVGTIARKGIETDGRPYRMARLYEK